MPFVMRVTLTGADQVIHALGAFEAATDDLSEPFRQIAADSWQVFARRFRQQGPGWAPLSAGYAAWKAEHYPGKPILEASGALLSQLTGDTGWWQRIGPQRAEFGVSLGYFGTHQFGDAGRHVPARPIAQFTPEDTAQFAGRIHAYLLERARQAGLSAPGGQP